MKIDMRCWLPLVLIGTGVSAAGAASMTLPTVLGTAGVDLLYFTTQVTQTLATGAAGTATTLFDFDADRLRTKAIRIPAGAANGIYIKNLAAVAACTVYVYALFSEANF